MQNPQLREDESAARLDGFELIPCNPAGKHRPGTFFNRQRKGDGLRAIAVGLPTPAISRSARLCYWAL